MSDRGSTGPGFADRLAAVAPLDSALGAALARFEHLGLADLQRALSEREDLLRAWANDPANSARPSSASPEHIERVVLGLLLEHRTLGA